ncbi:hypothetical protein FHG87_020388 [Trinorchestia longiramus]|nr:hypothetical protein FHG87_020388 [Trinorchestia longiramus]
MEAEDEHINDSGVSLITADRVLSPPYSNAATSDTVDLYEDLTFENNEDLLQKKGSDDHTVDNSQLNVDEGDSEILDAPNQVFAISSQQTAKSAKCRAVEHQISKLDMLDDCLLGHANSEESMKKLISENSHLQSEIEKIRSQSLILQKNMSSLWKTARTQLKEKDEKITELTRKYEALVFRRSIRSIAEEDLDRLVSSISSYTPVKMHQFLQELRGGRSSQKSYTTKHLTSQTLTDIKSTVRGTVLAGVEANDLLPLLPVQQQRLVSGVSTFTNKGPHSIAETVPTNIWDKTDTVRKDLGVSHLSKSWSNDKLQYGQLSANRAKLSHTTRLIKQAKNVLKRRRFSAMWSPLKFREARGNTVVNNVSSIADVAASSMKEIPFSILSNCSQNEASESHSTFSGTKNQNVNQTDTAHSPFHFSQINSFKLPKSDVNDVRAATEDALPLDTALVSDKKENIPEKLLFSSSKLQTEDINKQHLSEKAQGDSQNKRRKQTRRSSSREYQDCGQANPPRLKENNKVNSNKNCHRKENDNKRGFAISESGSRSSRSFSPNRYVHYRNQNHSDEKLCRSSRRRHSRFPRFEPHHEISSNSGRIYDRSTKRDIRSSRERQANRKPRCLSQKFKLSPKNVLFDYGGTYHRRRRIENMSNRIHRERINRGTHNNNERSFSPFNSQTTGQNGKVQSRERKRTSRSSYSRRKKNTKNIDNGRELEHMVADSTVDPKVGEDVVQFQTKGQDQNILRLSPKASTFIDADNESLSLERKRLLAELKVIEKLEASSHLPSENLVSALNAGRGQQTTEDTGKNLEYVGMLNDPAMNCKKTTNIEHNVICKTPPTDASLKVVRDVIALGTSPAKKLSSSSKTDGESRELEHQVFPREKTLTQKPNGGESVPVISNVILNVHGNSSGVVHSITADDTDKNTEFKSCGRNIPKNRQFLHTLHKNDESTSRIVKPRFVNIMDDTIDRIVENYNENNPSLSPVPSEASLLHFLDRSENKLEPSVVTFKNALDVSNCVSDNRTGHCKGQTSLNDKVVAHATSGDYRERERQQPGADAACMNSDQASSYAENCDLYLKNTRRIRRIHPTPVLPDTHHAPSALLKSQVVELVPVKEYTLNPKLRLSTSSTEAISSSRPNFESSSRFNETCTKKSAIVGKSTEISDDERDIGNSDSDDSITDVSEVSKDSFIAKTSDEETLTSNKKTSNLTFLNLDLSLSADSNEEVASQSGTDCASIGGQQPKTCRSSSNEKTRECCGFNK